MAGTKRLFWTHDIHTQYIISSHTFHSSFSHKVTFYTLRNNFISSSCAKNTSMWCRGQRLCAPAILPTNCYEISFCAQNPNIFYWRISTLRCTDLSPLPERYRVEPSRWGALEEKPSHNLLQPVVRHACAMMIFRAWGFHKTCWNTMSYDDRTCRQCNVL